MGPKKGVKMDLGSFLADTTFGGGSWADDDVDLNDISIPAQNRSFSSSKTSGGAIPSDPAFGGFEAAPRRDRQEFPVPDAPPFIAVVNNLSWEATEDDIGDWFNTSLQTENAIKSISAPREYGDPNKLKGFAFVTLETRDLLVKALTFSGSELLGRRVFVNVAEPGRGGDRFGRGDDLDWGSARAESGAPRGGRSEPRGEPRERRPPREEPDLDWGSARTAEQAPSRSYRGEPRGEPRERRPPRDEPDLDWGSARTSDAAPSRSFRDEHREPRERKPRREEPDLDWGSARTAAATPSRSFGSESRNEPRGEVRERKPRREEPELDWDHIRTSAAAPSGQRFERKDTTTPRAPRTPRSPKSEKEFDWSQARSGARPSSTRSTSSRNNNKPRNASNTGEGAAARSQQSSVTNKATKEPTKPVAVKPSFAVLANDDDEEEDEDQEEEEAKPQSDITTLEGKTAALSVSET